jgi:hypothetical protein
VRSLGRDILLLVLGAAFALGGSLITGLIALNAERESFLREQRLADYSALLAAMTEMDATIRGAIAANIATDWDDLPTPGESQRAIDPAIVDELNTAFSRVQVVGSAAAVAEHGMSYYSKYLAFVEERLAEIAEDTEDGSNSQTDWFYDGGAAFMVSSADCLRLLAREPFVGAVQTDLGLDPTTAPTSSVCSEIEWDNLYTAFVDALVAGSFPSSEDQAEG